MKERNYSSVISVTKLLHISSTWIHTEHQFMKERKHFSVTFVRLVLLKRYKWKDTLLLFMEENDMPILKLQQNSTWSIINNRIKAKKQLPKRCFSNGHFLQIGQIQANNNFLHHRVYHLIPQAQIYPWNKNTKPQFFHERNFFFGINYMEQLNMMNTSW